MMLVKMGLKETKGWKEKGDDGIYVLHPKFKMGHQSNGLLPGEWAIEGVRQWHLPHLP